MREPLLKVQKLFKRFGDFQALDNVGFEVFPGEILGLIGPNGAGKTTLLECLSGILLPDQAGPLIWKGSPLAPGRRKEVLFYLPDGMVPYGDHFVPEVLELFSGLYANDKKRLDALIERLNLSGTLRKKVAELSKGTLKRVSLALGLLTTQPLLILDEPFDGLDLHQTRSVMELLREIRAQGRTLLLSIHQLADAERVCDRFLLLNNGQCAGEGSMEELKKTTGLEQGGLEQVFLALT